MCEECLENSKVVDSRMTHHARVGLDNTIRRRRECMSCGERFTTYEIDSKAVKVLLRGEAINGT